MKHGAIILAAGSSSRMGSSKQMLAVNGQALLSRTVGTVIAGGISDVVVVLGANESTHRQVLQGYSVNIVVNERWERGMGSSIKAGLNHLGTTVPDLQAVFIFVCDQPLLTPDVISAMTSKFDEAGKLIVASGYSEAAGVPVLFDRSYFDRLLQLPDDQGAKKIILENPDNVVIVPFPGGETDLDTREDYEHFLKTS